MIPLAPDHLERERQMIRDGKLVQHGGQLMIASQEAPDQPPTAGQEDGNELPPVG